VRTAAALLIGALLLAPAAAGADGTTLELRGKVSGARYPALEVAIFGVEAPYTAYTLTDPGGTFRFRGLLPAAYTVSVVRRGLGEVRRTVVVTPALADKKGVVRVEIPFTPAEAAAGEGAGATVSRNQLAAPAKAAAKYRDAERRLGKRDPAGAEKLLLQAVDIAPRFAAAWNLLGVIAYQTGDLARSEQRFRRALEIEPDSFEPTVNLGGVLLSERRPDDALAYNLRAVELRPRDPLANAQLGMSYYFLGRMEEARKHLEAAKLADPAHFTQPQLYLAGIHERRGDKAAEARELEDLLARRPDSAQADAIRRRLATLK
jgi:Tfp pilus assembly protein PilF